MAASIAFYSAFSLAPTLVMVIAVAGWFFGADAARGEVFSHVHELIGNEAAAGVQTIVENAHRSGSRGGTAALISFAMLAIGASATFASLNTALSVIWPATETRASSVLGLVRVRLISFGLVLGVAFLLIVSLVLDTAITFIGRWLWGASRCVPAQGVEVAGGPLQDGVNVVEAGREREFGRESIVDRKHERLGAVGDRTREHVVRVEVAGHETAPMHEQNGRQPFLVSRAFGLVHPYRNVPVRMPGAHADREHLLDRIRSPGRRNHRAIGRSHVPRECRRGVGDPIGCCRARLDDRMDGGYGETALTQKIPCKHRFNLGRAASTARAQQWANCAGQSDSEQAAWRRRISRYSSRAGEPARLVAGEARINGIPAGSGGAARSSTRVAARRRRANRVCRSPSGSTVQANVRTSDTGLRGFCGQLPGAGWPTATSMTGTSVGARSNASATPCGLKPIIGPEASP